MKNKVVFALFFVMLFCTMDCAFVKAQPYITYQVEESKDAIKNWEDFKKTTTLVIIDDEKSIIQQTVMNNIEKYWKITKYKFVTMAEAEAYAENPDYSFFMAGLMNYYEGNIKEKNYKRSYFELLIYLGCPRNYLEAKEKRPLYPAKLIWGLSLKKYKKPEITPEDEKFFIMQIPLYVRNMQICDSLKKKAKVLTIKEKIKKVSTITYFYGKKEIQNKTLLIQNFPFADTAFVNIFSKALNKSVDSIKVVSYDEIIKAIEDKDNNVITVLEDDENYRKSTTMNGRVYGNFIFNLWSTDGKAIANGTIMGVNYPASCSDNFYDKYLDN